VSAYRSLADLGARPIWPGILARLVEGKDITFAVVELSPGAIAKLHQHPQEQVGLVLKGTMHFVIGDERRTLVTGDTYLIPSNLPHQATAGPEGAVVIDVFAPIRADWHQLDPGQPTPPVWP
jgi:quercetin dioxygenase-like cupin family protein